MHTSCLDHLILQKKESNIEKLDGLCDTSLIILWGTYELIHILYFLFQHNLY